MLRRDQLQRLWHRSCSCLSPMRSGRGQRGFTLVELMVVVAIVAALATLAVYGVRKYVFASKAVEPVYMIGQIKTQQEAWREEFHAYYDVSSSLTAYYPADPSNKKSHWVMSSHADFQKWLFLGVSTPSPVQFGYITKAGGPADVPPGLSTAQPGWPPAANGEPWFLVLGVGDLNEDGNYSKFVGSSFTQEIYAENESE